MAPLEKQAIDISFAGGIDTKTDPKRVSIGQFLKLENSIFTKAGLLQKRNGYQQLASLPDNTYNSLGVLGESLIAYGENLAAYAEGADIWVTKGKLAPLSLSSIPLVRSGTNQSQCDAAVASNGLVCTVFKDDTNAGPIFKYSIHEINTGHAIVSSTVIPVPSGTVENNAAVFAFGNYFLILMDINITGTHHLQMLPISILNLQTSTIINVSSQLEAVSSENFDATAIGNQFFVAWGSADTAVRVTYFDTNLLRHSTVTYSTQPSTIVAISGDPAPTIASPRARVYVSWYDAASKIGQIAATDFILNTVWGPSEFINGDDLTNISLAVVPDQATLFYEVAPGADPHLVKKQVWDHDGTLLTSETIVARGVGLASSAFEVNDIIYVLTTYEGVYQPTYFLMDDSGRVVAKLAYSNGQGYITEGTPSVSVIGSSAYISFLRKDLIQAIPKELVAANTPNVYGQLGVYLAKFDFSAPVSSSVEIANTLHISGGIMWMYDGAAPVEHGFFLWPEGLIATPTQPGGDNLIAQQYFYQVVYEWVDAEGNVHQSAPSVPLSVDLSGAGGNSRVTLSVPTLRLTYKISNPVKIVIYRWSTAQQTFFQVTSTTSPTLNDPTADTITFVDNLADASIQGGRILYTTGGVLENIAAPACNTITLFQSRLFLVDAEDPNLLWFSKQVIEATPVEMSDLMTIYVSPTVAAQGSTGPITALAALDDKLIIFKKNAIYYLNGVGPDNTGANNQFSEPAFVTSTVGCSNEHSIVFIPNGLLFQSDKGIWLLGRDLSTEYIGARVEQYNSATVQSAINVPSTNQVRFTLDNGVTLMYDYFYNQWGVFTNIPAIRSALLSNLHTYIDSRGMAFKETPGLYLDGSKPVLMKFQTGWVNLGGLQGFERFYFAFLLGEYITPFKLNVEMSYDYNGPSQNVMVTPDNFTGKYGSAPTYGDGSPYGGPGNVFEARIFPQKQKCGAFQMTVTEVYDSTLGVAAGAGLTLSGLNVIVGAKKGYRVQSAGRSFGK